MPLKWPRLEALRIIATMFFHIAVLLCLSSTIYANETAEQCHDITEITMETVTNHVGKAVPKLKWSIDLKDRAEKYAEDESEDDGNYIYLKKEMQVDNSKSFDSNANALLDSVTSGTKTALQKNPTERNYACAVTLCSINYSHKMKIHCVATR